MKFIKLKKIKVEACFTTSDPALTTPPDRQIESLSSLAASVPKLFVVGRIKPQISAGVEFNYVEKTPTVKQVLAYFLAKGSGQQLILMCEPNVLIDKSGLQKLLDYVDYERHLLTWGAVFTGGFVFSTMTLTYLYAALPDNLKFTDNWYQFVKLFAENHLRHRLVNGEPYGITSPVVPPPPPPPPPAPAPEPEPVKEEPVLVLEEPKSMLAKIRGMKIMGRNRE